jgi:hypothetical protein
MSSKKKEIWYLQIGISQFGPLTEDEAMNVIRGGKIRGEVKAKKVGTVKWIPVSEIQELTNLNSLIQETFIEQVSGTSTDKRDGERFDLLSTVKYSFNGELGAAVCRDLSKSGIYLISSVLPPEGSVIRMKISPVHFEKHIEFKATGVVVRHGHNPMGFAVELQTMSKSLLELCESGDLKNLKKKKAA